MTSETATHHRNLETSMLFMQEQHANTLKALHAEIAKLQKKCSDATFQLTMQLPDLNKAENERLKRCHKEEVDKLLHQKEHVIESVHKKERKIKAIEHQMKVHEKKYIENLRQKDVTLIQLKEELESKSNSIAYLTTELHKLKIKQQRRGSGNSRTSSDSGGSRFEPAPPKHGAPPKVRSYRRLDSTDNVHKDHSKCIGSVGVANPSHIMRPGRHGSSDSPRTTSIPDPSPFLKRDSLQSLDSSMNMGIKTANPLPPISGKEMLEDLTIADCDIMFHPSCGPQANAKRISSNEQLYPEVETLAVDQLTVAPGLPWQPAHGSKSSESH